MTLWTILVGALAGALAGAALWRWLRTGIYRIDEDEPRLRLDRSWAVVPSAAVGGALAGVLADPWLAIAAWIYLVGAVSLIWIDLDVHRVPDRVLRWWAPALLAAVLLGAAAGAGGWHVLVTAVLAGLAMAVLFGSAENEAPISKVLRRMLKCSVSLVTNSGTESNRTLLSDMNSSLWFLWSL